MLKLRKQVTEERDNVIRSFGKYPIENLENTWDKVITGKEEAAVHTVNVYF